MNSDQAATPRKPVKRHNGRLYLLTRAVSFVARLCPPGRILGTQIFRAAGGVFRILPTRTFRVAVTVAFYLHQLFGWRWFCILATEYTNYEAMVMKIAISSNENTFTWYQFLGHHLLGAMSRKLAIFNQGNTFTWYRFLARNETIHAWL